MLSSRLTGLQLADAPAALPKQSCGACSLRPTPTASLHVLRAKFFARPTQTYVPNAGCGFVALQPCLCCCALATKLIRRDGVAVALAAVEDSVQGDVSVFGATDWYDITDYQLLDEVESGIDRQLADACSSAASECLGLVLREDASRVQSKVHLKVWFSLLPAWLSTLSAACSIGCTAQEEVSPLSKRRTRKVSLLPEQLHPAQAAR